MLDKRILPEGFNFDVPSVELIGCGSRGLDKTAMLKRASAFDDIIDTLPPKKDSTYLHVITTGSYEHYGPNRNSDAWNEKSFDLHIPHPEKGSPDTIKLDGGLSKYHDSSYMDKAAVYQEHKTKDTDPSGEIVAAKYNNDMHRGELIISVDNKKWERRLQKKASGQDIFLSIGASVPRDICLVCGRQAKTASEHCDHFRRKRMQLMDDGTICAVMNDSPRFYDISGVDVPADRIAFVLRKVASGEQVKTAALDAMDMLGARRPMVYTKAASILKKLAKMEKQVAAFCEGDCAEPDTDEGRKAGDDFILIVKNYPADEVIDSCNRKGMLLTPSMLFKLLGSECGDKESRDMLEACDDDCCGDCSSMMRDMEDDEDVNTSLLDGSFDQHFPADVRLANIVEDFMPMLGMTEPAVKGREIHIIISGSPKHSLSKQAIYNSNAQQALRNTYGRYLISFAAQNDDATCFNALRKIAGLGKQ